MTEKLYLFDFDGVIVDSLNLYEKAIRSCLEEIDCHIIKTREDFLDLFEENFYEAIAKKGVSLEAFGRASKILGPSIDYSNVCAFQGIKSILTHFSWTGILAVISSNYKEMVRETLRREKIDRYFSDILGADFMLSKTAKITYAMDRWGKSPSQTYYIGDTAGDIREAKSAGVHTVAVTWGWHSEIRLRAADPDFIIKTPGELAFL
ncbi:MAG: HAD-IA family hydrolase [Syntrophales bacterium]|jgi:phosphoglycolate phosphatase|nr:HAD-IA family hydrolase [Syntrophales bacterium]MDY0045641.1 HAD-IA family hydrolase [Syntrophales bacterium]